jgi:RNA polymerase sigma factor (sigma-70 family)
VYVQDTLTICWQSEALATAPKPTVHSEGKAAARRRRQMERQAERQAPRLALEAEQRLLAIEEHQAVCMARVIEQALEPSTAPLTESKPCDKPKGITQAQLVEWFQKWRKPIRSWFRNRCSVGSGDIDDLAQEVFLRLLRYPDADVDNPQGYLFRIAANVASEWRERSRVKKPHDSDWLDDLVLDEHEQPDLIWLHESDREELERVVNQLPPRQRQVLLDHVNEGKTYKQIAQDHGLTYRIVLRDLTKAYSTLRSQLR